MKNRILDYLSPPKHNGRQTQLPQEWRQVVQTEFQYRVRQIETYVRDHPATGIGGAFCIGVLVGWIIKRR